MQNKRREACCQNGVFSDMVEYNILSDYNVHLLNKYYFIKYIRKLLWKVRSKNGLYCPKCNDTVFIDDKKLLGLTTSTTSDLLNYLAIKKQILGYYKECGNHNIGRKKQIREKKKERKGYTGDTKSYICTADNQWILRVRRKVR